MSRPCVQNYDGGIISMKQAVNVVDDEVVLIVC